MIDDEVKIVAIILISITTIAVIYPTLASGRIMEPFSEIGILGPNGELGNYPEQVAVGQNFKLNIFVENYEGRVEYYRVLAKIGDQFSNISDMLPLNAASIASWDLILMNGQNSTFPINLSLSEPGLNRRLVFELQMLDVDSDSFMYHHRWTQLWMNVTKIS